MKYFELRIGKSEKKLRVLEEFGLRVERVAPLPP
jgi:hypothetical protein